MTVTRMAPPPIEPRCPDCSVCGKETYYEEGFVCEHCGIWWPEPDGITAGEWDEDDEAQCRWEVQPWKDDDKYPGIQGHTYRCLFVEGHEAPEGQPLRHCGIRSDNPDSADTFDWPEYLNDHYNARQVSGTEGSNS